MNRFVLCAVVMSLWLVSCGNKQMDLDPTKLGDKALYETGTRALEDEDWEDARKAFKTVFENFPKSDYRILAKLGIADSYYLQGSDPNYLLAIEEYQDFISLFPFSPKAEYAQYQIGMCYFHMMEKPDRDQTNTRKALEEFRKVIDTYPNGQFYQKAYERLLQCYSRLAEHEYLIARFYQNTGRHQAAVDRLKSLLKNYPESVYQPKYYFALGRSLKELNQNQESCTYFVKLLEKWPKSDLAQEAKEEQLVVCR